MMISVRIIAPDLVEVTARPSWWERPFGARDETKLARLVDGRWCFDLPFWLPEVGPFVLRAIERAVRFDRALHQALELIDAARRRAETTRNYQAAAQRGEYPIR